MFFFRGQIYLAAKTVLYLVFACYTVFQLFNVPEINHIINKPLVILAILIAFVEFLDSGHSATANSLNQQPELKVERLEERIQYLEKELNKKQSN